MAWSRQSKKRSSFSVAMDFLSSSSKKASAGEKLEPAATNFYKLPPDLMLSMLDGGIHAGNRGLIWFHLSGANALRANNDSDTYGKLIRNMENADDESLNELKITIENDLKRYNPQRASTNPLYNQTSIATDRQKGGRMISFLSTDVGKMRRICVALALHFPKIGYNQAYLPIVRFVQDSIRYEEHDVSFI